MNAPGERAEYLDAKGRFLPRMYDELVQEVGMVRPRTFRIGETAYAKRNDGPLVVMWRPNSDGAWVPVGEARDFREAVMLIGCRGSGDYAFEPKEQDDGEHQEQDRPERSVKESRQGEPREAADRVEATPAAEAQGEEIVPVEAAGTTGATPSLF